MGNSEEQTLKDRYGRKEQQALHGNPGNQEGDDSLKISSVDSSEIFELWSLKNLLVSLKKELDRCLERLEMVHLSFGSKLNSPGKLRLIECRCG